jgi:prepilin-type N-terminal cleavage/methylation domain-containing protein
MKRILGRVRKSFRYGEKGFTLIELLIVVAILGILAAVVIPNVSSFLRTGQLAAANTEAAAVKTASAAYFADGYGFPVLSTAPMFLTYLDKAPKSTYNFVTPGIVDGTPTLGWADAPYSFPWSSANQTWTK